MIVYFVLFQAFAVLVHARPNHIGEMIMNNLMENDANLNPGFSIEAFRLDQLNLHNYYRSLHGVPAMTRDAALEAKAQQYAETLAANNQGLIHCKLPSCDREGAGENLASSWGSTTAETNATKAWYDEVWDYNYCHHENNFNRPGHEGKAIGHFTQVIWKTSTKLGIGYARTSDKTRVYVVGRYLKHGNVRRHYGENVPKADYLFQTFQDNCDGDNGGLSGWSKPGECSRSCGGGVRFQTRTCTNPKPSLNGADCSGDTTKLASQEWCNIESCPEGDLSHRDQQCEKRGHPAQSHIFSNQCKLYCYSGSGNVYSPAGDVNDGSITGSYTDTPGSNVFKNKIFTVPDGATNVVITNRKFNDVEIMVGYTSSGSMGYKFGEASWMNKWVDYQGYYEKTQTIVGVTFVYRRDTKHSTIKIAGPVSSTPGFSLVLFVKGSSSADISWTYDA